MAQPDILLHCGSVHKRHGCSRICEPRVLWVVIAMIKILKSRWRYPLFFLGILIIEIGGLYYKFISANVTNTAYFAVVGCILFVLSIILP
jgi:hypothetical protein